MGSLTACLACCLAVTAGPEANRLLNPGLEEGDTGWSGTQNAGAAQFQRSTEQAHTGGFALKMVCRTGDEYARWVQSRGDLFAGVTLGDRLRLTFWYRAEADLGDALVQINTAAPPGWRQYTLKPLRATAGAWLRYQADLTVDVAPNGSGEVQLRGTTTQTGDQTVWFDDITLERIGRVEPPAPLPFPPSRRRGVAAVQIRVIETEFSHAPLRTAASELQRFIEERQPGHRVEIRPAPLAAAAPAEGTLLLGTAGTHPTLGRWLRAGRLHVAPSADVDAYEVAVVDGCVAVLGANPRAALYAAYELEDVLAEQGGVAEGIQGAPALRLRLLHPRARGGFHAYQDADFEFLARCGGNVAHLSHDWMGEKTLFSFVPCPEFPEATAPDVLARNRESLRRYLRLCEPYGLRSALWLCEVPCQGGPWVPDPARQAFLQHFPAECLSDTGTYQGKVLCLAHPLVQQAYRGMVRRLLTEFPELGMVLVFTLDSSGELCDPTKCPRHAGVSKLTQYNRLLALLAEAGRAVKPDFEVYSVGWSWSFRGDPEYLAQQAALPAGCGLTAPPDAEAWSFDRKLTDALVDYRRVTREHGQPFLGYDILFWGDDTVFPETELYDFPLGIAAKLRRWVALGADGVFDQWGTQGEYVQADAVALRQMLFHPELTEPARAETWTHELARRCYGEAAGDEVWQAWRAIEAAQRIQSDHAWYWHHLRPGWAGITLSCPLTDEALQAATLSGGEPPKPYQGHDYAPCRDDRSRAAGLAPALSEAADHFARAVGHLKRALESLPDGRRAPDEHWWPTRAGWLPRLTVREQIEKELVAVELQERTQRRFGQFFAGYARTHAQR